MNSVIRIVKRGRLESRQHTQVEDKHESEAPSESQIASTIKSWITDWEQRRRMTERSNWNILTKLAQ